MADGPSSPSRVHATGLYKALERFVAMAAWAPKHGCPLTALPLIAAVCANAERSRP